MPYLAKFFLKLLLIFSWLGVIQSAFQSKKPGLSKSQKNIAVSDRDTLSLKRC